MAVETLTAADNFSRLMVEGIDETQLRKAPAGGLCLFGEPMGNGGEEDYPTHVAWSKEQMGREAVRRLFAMLEHPEDMAVTVKISTELVDRGTGGRGPEA